MDFLDLVKARYSVRKFSDQKVEQEKVELILEAGRWAPTAANSQPQRILILDSEEQLEALKACTPFHFDAPLVLLVCYDQSISWKRSMDGFEMGAVDASIVATHMMLQISDLGLGSTWVGHFDSAKLSTIFSLPANMVPTVLLPVGYPDPLSHPHPNHEKRFALTELILPGVLDHHK